MTGWNLPPGCSVSDLPGNRPEELAMEAFFDAAYNEFPASMSDDEMEKLADWIWEQVSIAFDEGYKMGAVDAREAEEFGND